MSLFTDGKKTGLDSKNQSLQKLYTIIEAEVEAAEQDMADLSKELANAQDTVLQAYKTYNDPICRTAAVEWI